MAEMSADGRNKEVFPIALYSLLDQIYIRRDTTLRDYLSENVITVGPFPINRLILLLALLVVLFPLRLHPWIIGWLLFEFLLTGDVWNLLRYGHIMALLMIVKRGLILLLA